MNGARVDGPVDSQHWTVDGGRARLAARLDIPREGLRGHALFAHCFTCGKDVRAAGEIARSLVACGIGVLRVDFTGLGESGGDTAETSFSGDVEDLVRAADRMREAGRAPQLLVGHSLGGAAVLAAAGRIPEVTAVATIGAPLSPADVTGVLGPVHEALLGRGEAEVDVDLGGAHPFRLHRDFLVDLALAPQRDRLAALTVPLLVLHAPDDAIVAFDQARQIAAAAGSTASLVALEGADHLLGRRGRQPAEPAGRGEHRGRQPAEPAGRGEHRGRQPAEPAGRGEHRGRQPAEPAGRGEHRGRQPAEPVGRGEHSADARWAAGLIGAWASRFLPAPGPDDAVLRAEPGTVVVSASGIGPYGRHVDTDLHRWAADEPESVGGAGSGPDPYQLLLSALGACTAITMRMYADRAGLPLDDATVTLTHDRLHAADCAECATSTGHLDRIVREIHLAGALDDAQRAKVIAIADRCPVHRTLTSEIVIETDEV